MVLIYVDKDSAFAILKYLNINKEVRKMKIGVDLDGVITPVGFINPSVRLPQWIYILFIPIILLILPTKRKELREIKVQGHTIIIISARPKWCENLTRIWLKYHWVSFTKIYCVGFGKGTKQRKLQIIEKEEIEIFIDDDSKTKKFLQKNSIKVISFGQLNGWLENSHFYLKRTTSFLISKKSRFRGARRRGFLLLDKVILIC